MRKTALTHLVRFSVSIVFCFISMLIDLPKSFGQGYDITYYTTWNGYQSMKFNLLHHCNSQPPHYANFPVTYSLNNGPAVTENCGAAINAVYTSQGCGMMPSFCSDPLDINMDMHVHDFNANQFSTAIPLNINAKIPTGTFPSYSSANILGTYTIVPETFNVSLPNILNKGPEFYGWPQVTVNHNQRITFYSGATDPDGDSLVYSLRPISPNAIYKPGLSYLNPIPTRTPLVLNRHSGSISFQPTVYVPVTNPASELNRYIIGIQVDEYRKINGVVKKLGTAQRNLMVTVISDPNKNPHITATYGNSVIQPDTVIDVLAGSVFSLGVVAADSNAQDLVSISSDANSVLLGATVSYPTAGNPVNAIITWNPTTSSVRAAPYFFSVYANDNHCPNRGRAIQTFGVRVLGVTGIKQDLNKEYVFTAFPNPFSEVVNFTFNVPKAQKIIIYNLLGQQIEEISLKTVGLGAQKVSWQQASEYAAGTYVAKLITADGTAQTLKFTKLQ